MTNYLFQCFFYLLGRFMWSCKNDEKFVSHLLKKPNKQTNAQQQITHAAVWVCVLCCFFFVGLPLQIGVCCYLFCFSRDFLLKHVAQSGSVLFNTLWISSRISSEFWSRHISAHRTSCQHSISKAFKWMFLLGLVVFRKSKKYKLI